MYKTLINRKILTWKMVVLVLRYLDKVGYNNQGQLQYSIVILISWLLANSLSAVELALTGSRTTGNLAYPA